MKKSIYIIRHCKAKGQAPEAQLTESGFRQAEQLTEFLSDRKIERLISSPFTRAVLSVQPLSEKLTIDIENDARLAERILSTKDFPDWPEKLEATFDDINLSFESGESSLEATGRAVAVIEDMIRSKEENIAVVTHGNLMSLLIRHYNPGFGFKEWKSLSNPDVYLLTLENSVANIEHIWVGQE
ncbi:histidine phosphatase family protein [Mesobacillus zeae]|uniref:Histidine phosphatase family protein n=1 Tax=Mesobacillus zeae TaxID=1917180 RepID=A0A398B8P6_9BACI|nr:histidine phosphatase family protein [Mesobacillus zeae]RID84280.1 histidine phosphatase family protein [Mesobacillus zeae]